MAGLFTITSFDSREKFCDLRERDIALDKLVKFEACVTKWYAKTTKHDGTRLERRKHAELAASNELGYSV
jgi:hypothetical protein